jgi:hypothetical protein
MTFPYVQSDKDRHGVVKLIFIIGSRNVRVERIEYVWRIRVTVSID